MKKNWQCCLGLHDVPSYNTIKNARRFDEKFYCKRGCGYYTGICRSLSEYIMEIQRQTQEDANVKLVDWDGKSKS